MRKITNRLKIVRYMSDARGPFINSYVRAIRAVQNRDACLCYKAMNNSSKRIEPPNESYGKQTTTACDVIRMHGWPLIASDNVYSGGRATKYTANRPVDRNGGWTTLITLIVNRLLSTAGWVFSQMTGLSNGRNPSIRNSQSNLTSAPGNWTKSWLADSIFVSTTDAAVPGGIKEDSKLWRASCDAADWWPDKKTSNLLTDWMHHDVL